MPFDALGDKLTDDLARLYVVRDGIAAQHGWCKHRLGVGEAQHCLLGWLMVATDHDTAEATRLAIDYLYPALPPSAQKPAAMRSIYDYNDRNEKSAVLALVDRALERVK